MSLTFATATTLLYQLSSYNTPVKNVAVIYCWFNLAGIPL